MFQRAIMASGGESDCKSGTIPNITTTSGEATINTGISGLKSILIFFDTGSSATSGCIGWVKSANYNTNDNYFFSARISSSSNIVRIAIGTTATNGGIKSINESTGEVVIQATSQASYIPMKNIKWYAQ